MDQEATRTDILQGLLLAVMAPTIMAAPKLAPRQPSKDDTLPICLEDALFYPLCATNLICDENDLKQFKYSWSEALIAGKCDHCVCY